MPRSPLPALLACALLGGCYGAPGPRASKSPQHAVQRVLSPDFSTAGFAGRAEGISRSLAGLAAEPARLAGAAKVPGLALDQAAGRTAALPERAKDLVGGELSRWPRDAGAVAASLVGPGRAAQDMRQGAEGSAQLFAIARRPMGEIDDVRHRTDPHDDHPEASLWQRLARRLGL